MGEILWFTGETCLDIPPDRVLESAVGKLKSVIILGYDHDDERYYASSTTDRAEMVLLLERFKHILVAES